MDIDALRSCARDLINRIKYLRDQVFEQGKRNGNIQNAADVVRMGGQLHELLLVSEDLSRNIEIEEGLGIVNIKAYDDTLKDVERSVAQMEDYLRNSEE